jgi:protein-disulfide isomerase
MLFAMTAMASCLAQAMAHGGAAPTDSEAVPADEAARIETVLRRILEDHPDIVAKALEDHQRAEKAKTEAGRANLIAELLPQIQAEEGGFALGPRDAKVTVVDLFDYHCAPCKRATVDVLALAEKYKDVRFLFKEMPVLRAESRLASMAALAARNQGKYVALHAAFMNTPGVLTRERITEIARAAGLDVETLDAAMRAPGLDAEIDATVRLAKSLAVEGTPAFFVNGEFLPGRDNRRLVELIEKARNSAAAPPRGASE